MKSHVNSASAILVALLGILPAFALSRASEYLGNNQRDGFVDASIPTEPVLLWTYQQRHAPQSAWPEPYGELQFIDFDYADQTTFGHGLVFFGSSADHTIRALDQQTGVERWTFYTEGPVRFAPVLHKERLYAVSDDGNLYCLDTTDGTLVWKLRLAPGDERAVGEGRLEQVRQDYRRRIADLTDALEALGFRYHQPEAGMYVFCDAPASIAGRPVGSASEAADALLALHGLAVVPWDVEPRAYLRFSARYGVRDLEALRELGRSGPVAGY